MNKMKKFAGIATAVLMTACMAAPMTMSLTASAANVDISITLPTPLPENSSLQEVFAYQIFAGTYQEPTAEGSEGTLNISGWGSGIDVAKFITELKTNEAFNENGVNAFASVTYDDTKPAVSAQAVADIIGKWSDDSATAKAFAKLAVLNINANSKITGTYNKTSSKVTFTDADLPDGYYLFTCELNNVTNSATNYDSMSLGMLTIIDNSAKNLKIGSEGEAKVGLPEVMKKVYENTKTVTGTATIGSLTEPAVQNGGWNDVADYCIGDSVPFKLYGTMPQDIANYEHYYYNFTDTLGTQFDMPTSLTIKVGNAEITATKGDTGWTTSDDTGKNCRVSVNGQVISISFEDIKAYSGVTASTVVTVEYRAKLNNTAEIGLPGQENKVDLTYSNNPNISYKPDITNDLEETPDDSTPGTPGAPGTNTGTTPEDKVIVFTYEADFTKVDGVTQAPLGNVEFKLKNANGEFVTVDADGKVTGWATESTDGSKLISDSKGQFKVIGLDDGTYTLVETKPLDGYNPIEDTTVVISGGTVNNQEWNGEASSALTSFKYTVGNSGEKTGTVDEGIAQGTIENKKGSTLPSTGGIGTTLFYVGGGAMVAVAGVFLITKKRMGKKED